MTDGVALKATGISKTFGGVRALRAFDLMIAQGEIHGLLGQNGSGKSTFIKILAGYHRPDPGGSLDVGGANLELPVRPGAAAEAGMSFVHQDLAVVEDLTVLENMAVGRYAAPALGPIRWRRERARVQELLDSFALRFSQDDLVRRLSETDKALLAIVRAVSAVTLRGAGGILVLDEPTVYLPQDSLEQVFQVMRTIAERGTAILFVTHQLDEVLGLTDRVTVLRDGCIVGTVETKETNEGALIELILGRPAAEMYPAGAHAQAGAEVLRVQNLTGRIVQNASFSASEGETVGVTGLVGSGYEEVPYLLFGAQKGTGEIEIAGAAFDAAAVNPLTSMAAGMALVPANRLREGIAPNLSIEENVGLPLLRRNFRRGALRLGLIHAAVRRALHAFDVRPPEPERRLVTLSGGNQQKALLAKWLQDAPRVVLLHEPTQGVDVGARGQIFSLLRAASDRGTTVIIASAEHEDLGHLCDRVLVFRGGTLVAELTGAAVQPDRIVEESYRATAQQESVASP